MAAFCFALLTGYNSVLNGMQNAARQRAVVALHHGLLSWGRFLLAAGMVLWLGASSATAMMGYCLATVPVLLSQWWFFHHTLKPSSDIAAQAGDPSENRSWGAEIVHYSWPFATWGILGWGRLVSDRWALQVFGTTEDVGFYAVLFQLGYYPITILTQLVTQLASPICFQRAGDASDSGRIRRVYVLTWRMTAGAIAATLVVVALAIYLDETIFQLLVASEYHSVARLLPGMLLAAGLFASAQCCTVGIQSHLKTRSLVTPKAVVHSIGVILNVLGAAWGGIAGVVLANIVYSAMHLLWMVILSVAAVREMRNR